MSQSRLCTVSFRHAGDERRFRIVSLPTSFRRHCRFQSSRLRPLVVKQAVLWLSGSDLTEEAAVSDRRSRRSES
ncbi:hypothetical protein GJAV_G00140370 [Gymnothorax javanicus]|nr:hypothetical protein GJAV_G00140370 [Gymnothorax javanicus]